MQVYDNSERKFVLIRRNIVDKIIKGYKLIEEMVFEQFYNTYKYRKIEYKTGKVIYTKSFERDNFTNVLYIEETEYLEALKKIDTKNIIIKNRKDYSDGNFKISVDFFLTPTSLILIEVESRTKNINEYIPYRYMLEVTNNPLFKNESIASGNPIYTNTIIDGGDCAGKTTVIKKLLEKGIICGDRDVDNICVYMFNCVPEKTRVKGLRKTLKGKLKDYKVIFLVNTDEEEINRRLNLRKKSEGLSEFDDEALNYNTMYKKAGEQLKDISNFSLIEGNNKTVEEIVDKIEIIVKANK